MKDLSNDKIYYGQNIWRIDKLEHKSLLSDNIKNRLVRIRVYPALTGSIIPLQVFEDMKWGQLPVKSQMVKLTISGG
ncbi:hypothetical protein GGGNBK_15750 [Sporosarcina sp. ANT_H38]